MFYGAHFCPPARSYGYPAEESSRPTTLPVAHILSKLLLNPGKQKKALNCGSVSEFGKVNSKVYQGHQKHADLVTMKYT